VLTPALARLVVIVCFQLFESLCIVGDLHILTSECCCSDECCGFDEQVLFCHQAVAFEPADTYKWRSDELYWSDASAECHKV